MVSCHYIPFRSRRPLRALGAEWIKVCELGRLVSFRRLFLWPQLVPAGLSAVADGRAGHSARSDDRRSATRSAMGPCRSGWRCDTPNIVRPCHGNGQRNQITFELLGFRGRGCRLLTLRRPISRMTVGRNLTSTARHRNLAYHSSLPPSASEVRRLTYRRDANAKVVLSRCVFRVIGWVRASRASSLVS